MMKTNFVKTVVLALTLMGGLMMAGKANAQTSPYAITNYLSCSVQVDLVIQKVSSCIVCQSISGIVIGPGATTNVGIIPCLPNPCEITVTVTQMAGSAITPVSDTMTNGTDASGTGTSCAPNFTLAVNATGTSIY
jgi:hypothetical protein